MSALQDQKIAGLHLIRMYWLQNLFFLLLFSPPASFQQRRRRKKREKRNKTPKKPQPLKNLNLDSASYLRGELLVIKTSKPRSSRVRSTRWLGRQQVVLQMHLTRSPNLPPTLWSRSAEPKYRTVGPRVYPQPRMRGWVINFIERAAREECLDLVASCRLTDPGSLDGGGGRSATTETQDECGQSTIEATWPAVVT